MPATNCRAESARPYGDFRLYCAQHGAATAHSHAAPRRKSASDLRGGQACEQEMGDGVWSVVREGGMHCKPAAQQQLSRHQHLMRKTCAQPSDVCRSVGVWCVRGLGARLADWVCTAGAKPAAPEGWSRAPFRRPDSTCRTADTSPAHGCVVGARRRH